MRLPLQSEARLVWSALLRSGSPCDESRWRGWADAQILQGRGTPPMWLIDLSVASTHHEAQRAVDTDFGLDGCSITDREALIIGFVAGRYFNGELPLEAMWFKLRELTDIAEFLDSGRWKLNAAIRSGTPRASTQDMTACLKPAASFAFQKAFSLLAVGSDGPN